MRNRAKCKKCSSIIESLHPTDLQLCKCGEISVDGGDALRCYATNWDNFLRVDDNGKEIPVVVKSKDSVEDVKQLDNPPLTKADKLQALNEMIYSYEHLPQEAMMTPATNYDVLSVLLVLKSLFDD
jgi:hypothetical protein